MSNAERRLSVGYPCKTNLSFFDSVAPYLNQIREVYFGYPDFANGRSAAAMGSDQSHLKADLPRFAEAGVVLNLLLNGNCYGADGVSSGLAERVRRTVSELSDRYTLQAITTASPFIAATIKQNFPDIDVRASVNMWVDGVSGMEQCKDLFDSFYVKRDYNYCLEQLRSQRQWCDANGKRLYLLANSGCIPNCAYHTFHDNLVSHSAQLNPQDMQDATRFYACRRMLEKKDNRYLLLAGNLVRPEDIDHYSDLVDGIKLATRIHPFPAIVIGAYARRRFPGDLCALTEPGFGDLLHPHMLDNVAIPHDYWEQKTHCPRAAHNGSNAFCKDCGYCARLYDNILSFGI